MRIIVTSDTHYRPRYRAVLGEFVDEIARLNPDCVIHAGDVGEGIEGFDQMLGLMERLACPRLILTGNHDVWAERETTSEQLWLDTLPTLVRDHGAIWLEGENWRCEDIGVCGTNGWYDYTGHDPALAYTSDQYARMMRRTAQINWEWSDIEFAEMIGVAFSERLAALDAEPTIREILVVTHVPTFEEAILRRSYRRLQLRNAFSYNLTLGSRIIASPKVTRVVSGHIHRGVRERVNGGKIDLRVLPSDYGYPVYAVFDY